MITCARNGCEVEFNKRTHNMKYCSDECCRVATNQRIMEKYYARRAQRQGKVRYCSKCEVTRLSRYNDSHVCSACKIKSREETNRTVTSMLLSATA